MAWSFGPLFSVAQLLYPVRGMMSQGGSEGETLARSVLGFCLVNQAP